MNEWMGLSAALLISVEYHLDGGCAVSRHTEGGMKVSVSSAVLAN